MSVEGVTSTVGPDTFGGYENVTTYQFSATGDCTIDDVFYSNSVVTIANNDEGDFPVTSSIVYESDEHDLLAAPAEWGILDYTKTLNGGTVAVATNVSSTSGSGYDGWVAINATTGAIESALKRYLKVRITITPESSIGSTVTPEVHSWTANLTQTQIFIALANHRGRKVLPQVESYLKLADYEMAQDGEGIIHIRAKTTTAEPAVHLTQENGIIDVTEYDDGIPDRCVKGARVRHGEFVSTYDGSDASASAATLAWEDELGGEIVSEDLTADGRVALDADITGARAQNIYENSRRAADDPRPLRRLRLQIWDVPWLELSDVVRVSFFDNPYMRQFLAADPLHKPGPYYNMGSPANIIANAQNFKVIELITDEWSAKSTKDTATILVEELPS